MSDNVNVNFFLNNPRIPLSNRDTGRRLVSGEIVKLNHYTAWIRYGNSIIQRRIRRDMSNTDYHLGKDVIIAR